MVYYMIVKKARGAGKRSGRMGLHDGHRKRRRDMFLARGLAGMADHEVLELALFYALPRRDTNALAHHLIMEFGSLEGVLTAMPEELERVAGIGESAAVLLKLLGEVHDRLNMPKPPCGIVHSSEEAGQYFLEAMKNLRREALYGMCMDGKGKVLDCRCLLVGNLSDIEINIRCVLSYVLHLGGDVLVLAHNHPSGIALPSQADQVFTLQLNNTLRAAGIYLMDHIIVADGDYVSLSESGILMR